MRTKILQALLTAAVLVGLAATSQTVKAEEVYEVVELPYGKVKKETPNGYHRVTTQTKSYIGPYGYVCTDSSTRTRTSQVTPLYRSGTPNGVTQIIRQEPKPKPVKQVKLVAAAPQQQCTVDPAATTYYGNPSGTVQVNAAAPVTFK